MPAAKKKTTKKKTGSAISSYARKVRKLRKEHPEKYPDTMTGLKRARKVVSAAIKAKKAGK